MKATEEETKGTPFRSAKHDLPPDRLQVNLRRHLAARGALVMAIDYSDKDPEFSGAVAARVLELHPHLEKQGKQFAALMDHLDGKPGAEIPKPLPAMSATKVMTHVINVMEHLDATQIRRILLAAGQFYGSELEATG